MEQSKGPVVVIAAGDALFVQPAGHDPKRDVEKAELILTGMARMGTAAMAVGDRDLANGVPWLVKQAKAVGLPLLSANLTQAGGVRPFQPRLLVERDGVKVGLIGLWGDSAGRPPQGLAASAAVEAATEQQAALRKAGAELVVALVHGGATDASDVAKVPGIDLVVPFHDGSQSPPLQPAPGAAWIFGVGQRGRTVARVSLSLSTPPLSDADMALRLGRELEYLESRAADSRARLAAARPGSEKESLQRIVAGFDTRIADAQARIRRATEVAGSRFRVELVNLGDGIPDAPALAELVRAYEAKYPPLPHAH